MEKYELQNNMETLSFPIFHSVDFDALVKFSPVLYSPKDYTDAIRDGDAGIWQGRFQIIHNGHHYVFENSLTKFSKKFIAIVHPNPQEIPCDYQNFTNSDDNPFSYFQRLFLWNRIVIDYNKDKEKKDKIVVSFFPCWHAQQVVELENEFLVHKRERAWIVPFKQFADTSNDPQAGKAYALRNNVHERVHRAPLEEESKHRVLCESAISLDELHASRIRAILGGQPDKLEYQACVPECIADLQKRFYFNVQSREDAFDGLPINFITVPFIDDEIDMESCQYAIHEYHQRRGMGEDVYLVFAITVTVQDNDDWWFHPAVHDRNCSLCFRVKADMIHDLMQKQNVEHYLTTPYFVQSNSFETLRNYNMAFLPPNGKNVWMIKRTKSYAYQFEAHLRNLGAHIEDSSAYKISQDLTNFFAEYSCFVHSSKLQETLWAAVIIGNQDVQDLIEQKKKYLYNREGKTLAFRKASDEKLEQLVKIKGSWEAFMARMNIKMSQGHFSPADLNEFERKKEEILGEIELL